MTWEQFNREHERQSKKNERTFRIAIMRHFEKMLEAAEMNNFVNVEQVVSRVDHKDIDNAFIKAYQFSGTTQGFTVYDEMTGGKKARRRMTGDEDVLGRWLVMLEGIALDETIPARGAILTTSQEIFTKFVNEGIGEGMTVDQIAAGLRNRFEELLPWRSVNIARTETLSAMNYGGEIGAEQTGYRYMKRWLASLDGRERDAHKEAHLFHPPIQSHQSFFVGGEMLKFPGDPAASAENRVNCRCTITREII